MHIGYATPNFFRFSLDPAPVFRQSSKINFIVSMQHTIQYCITHHHWLGNRVFSTERYLSHNKKPTQQDVFIIGRDHQIISPAWYIKLYHQVIIVEEMIKLYHQVNDQGQHQVSCTFSYFWIPLSSHLIAIEGFPEKKTYFPQLKKIIWSSSSRQTNLKRIPSISCSSSCGATPGCRAKNSTCVSEIKILSTVQRLDSVQLKFNWIFKNHLFCSNLLLQLTCKITYAMHCQTSLYTCKGKGQCQISIEFFLFWFELLFDLLSAASSMLSKIMQPPAR